MDERLRQLPSVYKIPEMVTAKEGEEAISVSETVSKAAAVYEKLRNTLEYEEEHLLRRNAIRRVLKRRLGVDVDSKQLAKDLLTELIWARYLPNNKIPARMIPEVADVLVKYDALVSATANTRDPQGTLSWVMDLIATEVESLIVPPAREEALASFMFRVVSEHIEWKKGSLAEDERELQLFLAVHRTLLKADIARLRSRVFNLYHPEWKEPSEEQIAAIANRLEEEVKIIEAQVRHPIGEPLSRELRKYAVIFNVLFDLVSKDPEGFLDTAAQPDVLKKEVGKAADARTKKFQHRLRRLVVRAVTFLFLTKMLIAIAVELPYDLLISHATSFLPLLVNIFFPPTLLALIAMTARVPKKNIQNIQAGVKAIVYGEGGLKLIFKVQKPWSKSALGVFFYLLYSGTFLMTYGLIAWWLVFLGFNVVSIAIFLLFLSLVTFFGLRVRNSIREIVVEIGKPGVGSAMIDVFTLPIIRAGRWISIRTPRINVILFFMDFMIEAPFKLAIDIAENWLSFVREKKEEI